MTTLFGARLAGMPFTHLARVAHPARGRVDNPWHYWWQAHYLDAIIDAGLRSLRGGDIDEARARARRGDRLLRTIRLRNRARWVNDYYDDMAWLALAAGRLAVLHAALGRARPQRRLRTAERDLTRQLSSALTTELGGGLFWSVERDFKNVPASAPAALHLARLGRLDEARGIVDWLYTRLWSAESRLFLDGVRLTSPPSEGSARRGGRAEVVVPDIWSYNQGTVLGALVTIGDEQSLRRAADLVAAVGDRLTTEADGIRLLRTHGDGDGGLFTGILGRYLALAATTERLAPDARDMASQLVSATAEGLWRGRDLRGRDRSTAVSVWSPDPRSPARTSQPPGSRIELSTQVQAWMLLEAAAVV
ncbi:putative alpha-1,6-mannanase (GH76 family) [Humibacillus xanthopallidus]|uniref:Putative alpha-1,6-mannanase (GH76 family) n=1 Tax=Humibacillus xanthopallidus TaxID=412689 RepID=A0A543HAH1_9MICO|nr:putative alpha-1,6-mannanase (GH76 family) [Humibacillus xanthopallidus]